MPKFYYKILDEKSKIQDGYVKALFKKSAEKKIAKKGSTIILITKDGLPLYKKILNALIPGFSANEKINFFRNLSAMIKAGVSIVESLEVLSDQVRNKKVKNAIFSMTNDIKNGKRLSETMEKFPKYFPAPMVATINMGDLSGKLTETLDRISIDLEKNDEMKRKIQGAMLYPIIIITLMIIVATTLIVYVMPGVEKLYEDFGAPLPLLTRTLIDIGTFISLNPFLLLGAFIGVIAFFSVSLKIKKGRYIIHYLIIRTPIFGPLIKDYNLVLFFRSFALLTKSGISIVESIRIAKQTTKNDVYKSAIDKIEPIILHGVPFSETIIPFPFLFPTQTQKMMKVGEQSGRSVETLVHITNYYERSVDYKIKTLMILIEPVLMLIAGIAVGGLALSMFLPLYSLVEKI